MINVKFKSIICDKCNARKSETVEAEAVWLHEKLHEMIFYVANIYQNIKG